MSIKRFGPQEFEQFRKEHPEATLVDVREPFEQVAFGAIPNVVNIPLKTLPQRLDELPSDKQHPIVMICQSGGRSQSGAKVLVDKGYTNVYNLDGGTGTWRKHYG